MEEVICYHIPIQTLKVISDHFAYTTTTTTTSLFLTLNIQVSHHLQSKANRGRWCEDGLRLITIVEVKKKYHIYNKEGQSRVRVIRIRKLRQLPIKIGVENHDKAYFDVLNHCISVKTIRTFTFSHGLSMEFIDPLKLNFIEICLASTPNPLTMNKALVH